MIVQMMMNMIPQLQAMASEVPSAYWAELRKETRSESMLAIVVPVYQRDYKGRYSGSMCLLPDTGGTKTVG